MRNFEERMEEIRRRSEKIIKQRKKRRLCIAAVCVPAVLCVALLLPMMLPKATMEPNFDNGSVMESYHNMSQSTAYVEVSGNGVRKTLTEPETVEQILQLMTPAVPEANLEEETEIWDKAETVYKEVILDDSKDYSTSSTESYCIVVYQSNGKTESYTLSGNQLENEDGIVRILTSQELEILLGIVQGGNIK